MVKARFYFGNYYECPYEFIEERVFDNEEQLKAYLCEEWALTPAFAERAASWGWEAPTPCGYINFEDEVFVWGTEPFPNWEFYDYGKNASILYIDDKGIVWYPAFVVVETETA